MFARNSGRKPPHVFALVLVVEITIAPHEMTGRGRQVFDLACDEVGRNIERGQGLDCCGHPFKFQVIVAILNPMNDLMRAEWELLRDFHEIIEAEFVPVTTFVTEEILDDLEQAADAYFDTELFHHFPFQRFQGSFPDLSSAAGKSPKRFVKGAMHKHMPVAEAEPGDAVVEALAACIEANDGSLGQ